MTTLINLFGTIEADVKDRTINFWMIISVYIYLTKLRWVVNKDLKGPCSLFCFLVVGF